MSRLALLSPAAGSGKTTMAVMLAAKLDAGGVSRLGEDSNAASDSALFQQLLGSGDDLVEAPAGDAMVADTPAVVVADASADASELVRFCRLVGDRLAGVVLNRAPARRRDRIVGELGALGVSPFMVLPEDRVLATPSLEEVAGALEATTVFYDSTGSRPLERAVIASISADPGQGYFVHREASAVIVRSDKPDLQLAALNAGATCIVVTGEMPLLGYVKERAVADEIPLIRTALETGDAVRAIDSLYGSRPFSGSPAKLRRLAELTRDFDATTLLSAWRQ